MSGRDKENGKTFGATCKRIPLRGTEGQPIRLAHSEAKILHEKIGHKAYGDDEIIRIITTRSKAHLLATFNYYNDAFGNLINKVHTGWIPYTHSSLQSSAFGATCKRIPLRGTGGQPIRLAHSEAKILHEKIGHKAYGDDEIIRIITTRRKAHLLAAFNYYNDAFGNLINKVSEGIGQPSAGHLLLVERQRIDEPA